tara:strand:+ start:11643 stop:12224 length:582 start_codon:yes stop_codon:yes gene_type:complete
VKGEQTKSLILESALKLVSVEGLGAVSIGRLAKSVGLSKSGLFAHFKSKDALQEEVLERASNEFVANVVRPALKKPRGIPRLQAIFDNWLRWASSGRLPGGCIFVGAAVELDDKPGPLRDFLVKTQKDWVATLATAAALAIDEGHLPKTVAPEQIAFELYGIMMSYHLYKRLLGDRQARSKAQDACARLLGAA